MHTQDNDVELTQQQLLIVKRLGFVVIGGVVHTMPRKTGREIARQLYALAETDEDARQLILGTQWSILDSLRASERGWLLTESGRVIASVANIKFQSHEEAADHVKQLAQNGDILAQKALVTSARRQLNGNGKNDEGFTIRHPQ